MILALAGQLSNCLMNLKNSGDSTGFEPMTSAMPVQCSNQLSYEVTQWRAAQFAGPMKEHMTFLSWENMITVTIYSPSSSQLGSNLECPSDLKRT